MQSRLLEDYLKSVADQNENSAKTYRVRLLNFQKYLASLDTNGIDETIAKRLCDKYKVKPYEFYDRMTKQAEPTG